MAKVDLTSEDVRVFGVLSEVAEVDGGGLTMENYGISLSVRKVKYGRCTTSVVTYHGASPVAWSNILASKYIVARIKEVCLYLFPYGEVTFTREESDRKYYGIRHAAGEHALFYAIKKWLNDRGFAFIKKRAQKDGHMLGDEFQPIIRCRKPTCQEPHIAIYSGFYALRGANEDWNAGEVCLIVDGGHFLTKDGKTRQPDWRERIATLAKKHDDIEVELMN